MSKPKGVSVKLVQIWSALMQISGGFTYSIVTGFFKKHFKPRVQSSRNVTPGNPWVGDDFNKVKVSPGKYQEFCHEPKKLYFLFWSYFFIPLYVIILVLNVMVSVDEIYIGFKTADSTIRKTKAIANLYRPITLSILFISIIFSSEKLSCLLYQLNLVTPYSVPPTKWWSYKLFFVGLVTSCSCAAYVTITLFDDARSSWMTNEGDFTKYSVALGELVSAFITFNISFGYYVVGSHLSVLISDLREKIDAQTSLGNNGEGATQVKREAEKTSVKPDDKHQDENHLWRIATDLASITSNFQELHTFQEMTNEYFSPPLLAIFAQTMVYMTMSIFSATVEGLMYALQDFVIWFSFNTSMLLFLCCTPSFASSQLDELRFLTNQWRMKVCDPILETKLTYFLDLVDNFPPFSVGRFFVAAKARLIGIASFIATYLIILLQFRASENGKNENNSTCGAGPENTSSLDSMQ